MTFFDATRQFRAVGVIEKDSNNENLWTWIYPTISLDLRDVILRRSSLLQKTGDDMFVPYIYSQYNKQWHYMCVENVELNSMPKVKSLTIVLISSDFNPEKYESLGHVLMKQLRATGSPAAILQVYLSAFTKGTCGLQENGTFNVLEYPNQMAFANSKVKDVIQMFGLEIIIIYTAMLLKKRIFVYHPDVRVLLEICRSLPAFVWHRQNWNVVFPLVNLVDQDLKDLRSTSHYVAGFTDASSENRSDLYDVFVNAYTAEVSIANHCKDDLTMGKIHKELALFIVQCPVGENEDKTNLQCIKEIAKRTKDLIANLQSLSNTNDESSAKPIVTIEDLNNKGLALSTKNFLLRLASAERLLEV